MVSMTGENARGPAPPGGPRSATRGIQRGDRRVHTLSETMTVPTDRWAPLAAQLRADSIRATTAVGSGHPTSCLSAADLMAVLLDGHLRADWRKPMRLDDDRLIFSKGHAAPLLYAMAKAAGAISDEELLSLRKLGSRIEGHPAPTVPFVDVATGSLGQGLPAAVGIAIAARLLGRELRCWVLLGDSEMAEGSVYEALELGGHYGLSRIVAIVDMNRLGQRGPTMLQWSGERYAERARAFGWNALVVVDTVGRTPGPTASGPREGTYEPPRYEVGSRVSTREAFGDALRALGAERTDVVALDGEVSNSTYLETFGKAHPDRFFEMYIAEQQLVSAAVGMQVLGLVPF